MQILIFEEVHGGAAMRPQSSQPCDMKKKEKVFGDEAGMKERIWVKVDFPTGNYETLLFFIFIFLKHFNFVSC